MRDMNTRKILVVRKRLRNYVRAVLYFASAKQITRWIMRTNRWALSHILHCFLVKNEKKRLEREREKNFTVPCCPWSVQLLRSHGAARRRVLRCNCTNVRFFRSLSLFLSLSLSLAKSRFPHFCRKRYSDPNSTTAWSIRSPTALVPILSCMYIW